MNDPADSILLSGQLSYYRARAAEYDQWWLREGRYDRGADQNAQWFDEGAAIRQALRDFRPCGNVLELACGTGIWSEQLLPWAESLTCVDGSPEMLEITRNRLGSSRAHLVQADLFNWQPQRRYNTVFFGFWLSHVPPLRFEAFWEMVRKSLSPGGRVFFVDSLHDPSSTATDHQLPPPETTTLRRRLNNGEEYEIFKIFHQPSGLTARLKALGWKMEMKQTSRYFLYGEGYPDK